MVKKLALRKTSPIILKGLYHVCILPGHCAPSSSTSGWWHVSKAKKCCCVEEVRGGCFKVSFLPLASARDNYKDILSWTITTGHDSNWQQIISRDNVWFADTVPQGQTFVLKYLLSIPYFSFHAYAALRTALYLHPSSSSCAIWSIFHGQIICICVVSLELFWVRPLVSPHGRELLDQRSLQDIPTGPAPSRGECLLPCRLQNDGMVPAGWSFSTTGYRGNCRQVCSLKVWHQPMFLISHFCYEVLMGNGLNEVTAFLQDHRMAMCGTNT